MRDCRMIDVCDFVESEFVIEAQVLITLDRIITLVTIGG